MPSREIIGKKAACQDYLGVRINMISNRDLQLLNDLFLDRLFVEDIAIYRILYKMPILK